ncbi:tRNA adenosine(34) deaminase TadA [Mariprofundus sp. KV]|uniref:tRNA adenosine(34) deaminase TadA n=1 Tax=Mariprofundus sp. KV TaxID=2608715 RepID=UPI00159F791F|nr:tRNA adenosine(34) deaminase TadA [Mariprofundus sp. KV]NWF35509.1 nucleoside deaminase [Mariprofundus sp. KV]
MKDDNYYMSIALQQAEIAAEMEEVPVGALLLLADGSEVASHNAPIDLHDASAHAEMRVIREACRLSENYRLAGSTLYVTLEPCLMCAGAIVHARIGRVVYGASDSKTGAVESLYQILSDKRLNHQPEITAGILAGESSELLKSFFKSRRKKV